MRQIYLIAHNIRSTHNIGSIFRTAEGLGVKKLYLTGYTPYPLEENDDRLPHISKKLSDQIQKTSLNAHNSLSWSYEQDINLVFDKLKAKGIKIAALEQAPNSISLTEFESPNKIAILLGNEVDGVSSELLEKVDYCLEIPMLGKKESFNVVQACAMALYAICFY